jgi:limonene-1,2-epoxide hydrolase
LALALAAGLGANPLRLEAAEIQKRHDVDDSEVAKLVADYMKAVDGRDFAAITAMLTPDFEFDGPGAPSITGTEAYVAALRRIAPINERNDVKRVWVDGDEACVIYDFVTNTQVGALPSVEWFTIRDGKISRIRLIFHDQPWSKVLEELKTRPAA